MSTDDTTAHGREFATYELLEMDDQEARQTLTVAQYERWEKLTDLHEQADETREQWAEESEDVQGLVVEADMNQLGTRLNLFGNEVLVHVDSEDAAVREHAEALQDEVDDAPEDVEEVSEQRQERVASHLLTLLDAVIVEWRGTQWDEVCEGSRERMLSECRQKWGVDGLMLAWKDIAEAVAEDREDQMSTLESFRNPKRRGRR